MKAVFAISILAVAATTPALADDREPITKAQQDMSESWDIGWVKQ